MPVVIYFALGERADPILERLKTWMAQNNAVIMAVLLLIIGAKLIGDAISGLGAQTTAVSWRWPQAPRLSHHARGRSYHRRS